MPSNIEADSQTILQAAADIAEKNGAKAVTSRNIAQKLKCPKRSVSRGKINIRKLRQAVAVLVKEKGVEAITAKNILEEFLRIDWVVSQVNKNTSPTFSSLWKPSKR